MVIVAVSFVVSRANARFRGTGTDAEPVNPAPAEPAEQPAGDEVPDVRRGPLTPADTHVLDVDRLPLPDRARPSR